MNEKDCVNHEKIHNQEESKCIICSETFKSYEILKDHVQGHNKAKGHSCDKCDSKFETQSQLKSHVEQVHSVKLLEEKVRKIADKCEILEKEKENLAQQLLELERSSAVKKNSLEDENMLTKNKKSGFQRVNPQESASRNSISGEVDPKPSKSCGNCGTTFWTTIQLKNHIERDHMMELGDKTNEEIACLKCDAVFDDKSELREHMEVKHVTRIRQYNCEDCPFQGENGLELKKHVLRTQHNPSECIETCYTCKNEFKSYFHLMNHRNKEHPSNKVCRYFKDKACIFEADICWYRHESKAEELIADANISKFQFNEQGGQKDYNCNKCAKHFAGNSDLMKHNKQKHTEIVARCRNFKDGNCTRTQESCWFLHDEKFKNTNDDDGVTVEELNESKEAVSESDFCEVKEKSPPDQMSHLIKIIAELSLKVEHLEKMAQKNQ